jgi:hypothetical protein
MFSVLNSRKIEAAAHTPDTPSCPPLLRYYLHSQIGALERVDLVKGHYLEWLSNSCRFLRPFSHFSHSSAYVTEA